MTRRIGEAAKRREVSAQILAAGESVKPLRILTTSKLMSNRTENFNFVKCVGPGTATAIVKGSCPKRPQGLLGEV